jgi:hypothetical protein
MTWVDWLFITVILLFAVPWLLYIGTLIVLAARDRFNYWKGPKNGEEVQERKRAS